jgi:hypothetical protein
MPVVGLYLQTPISCALPITHYSSDVLAGAGIGLLSILVTNYNPFQAIKFGRKIEPRHLSILNLGKLTGWGSL